MKKSELKKQINNAIEACQQKKAENVVVLELEQGSGAFTDFFLICNGTNPRQVQAIADSVEERLEKQSGQRVVHREGYKQGEWVLLDYVDFVVHIFSEQARQYYDLERLWKSATRLEPDDLMKASVKKDEGKKKMAIPRKKAAARAKTKRTVRKKS